MTQPETIIGRRDQWHGACNNRKILLHKPAQHLILLISLRDMSVSILAFVRHEPPKDLVPGYIWHKNSIVDGATA